MNIRVSLLAFAASTLALMGIAQAGYPEKPITIIVPFAPGGGNDVAARMLAPLMAKYLGSAPTSVVVENKAGAGGELGFAAIADAPPDGYWVGFIATPNVVSIPIERKARYTLDKLDPLVCIVDDPNVITVNGNGPLKTIGDLVAMAKEGKTQVTAGTSGVGSDDHLAILRLSNLAKIPIVHVPFAGGTTDYKAMIANKVVVTGMNLGEALRARQTDPVLVLGVMSDKRSEMAPDIPTLKEQGYDIVSSATRGIAAPKGIPAEIRTKLVDAITKAANDPEFVRMSKEGYQPLNIVGPEDYSRDLNQMEDAYKEVWKNTPWLK